MLGSKHTFTYFPIKQWYLKPFGVFGRIQERTWLKQHNSNNAIRLFDIALSFDYGTPLISNGIFKFIYQTGAMCRFFEFANTTGLYVRVRYNKKRISDSDKEHFINYCNSIETDYPNINFFGGYYGNEQNVIYNFIRDNEKPVICEVEWNKTKCVDKDNTIITGSKKLESKDVCIIIKHI